MSEKMTPKTLRKPPFLFGSVQVEAWLQAHADAWEEQVCLLTEKNKQLRVTIDAMMIDAMMRDAGRSRTAGSWEWDDFATGRKP